MPARHAFQPRWLLNHLRELLPGATPLRCCVAYSGGVDSTALLAALVAAQMRGGSRRPLQLRAVHVEHDLQPAAPQWSAHCAGFAAQLRVPFALLRVKVPRQRGHSLEAQARTVRYAALAAQLQPAEALLTAHHLEDQLETFLLQAVRGAGVAGLAAMPAVGRLAPGLLVRPLLDCPRAALLGWAAAQRLTWIDDPSNADTGFDRNFLRHRVVPVLLERWPAAAASVARSARHAAEAQVLLEHVARRDVAAAADGDGLDVRGLRRLTPRRRRNALRYWIAHQGVELPDTRRLREMAGPFLAARRDAQPQLRWGAIVLRREQGRLRIATASTSAAPAPVLSWQPRRRRRLQLPQGFGSLEIRPAAQGALDLDRLPAQLRIAWRDGHESAALKKILQQARVVPAERARLPLLFDGARLLAVGDRWLHASLRARKGTQRRAQLRWHAPQSERPV